MNQPTDEPRFATVTAEGVNYPIYLTSPNRDYIQKSLATKGVPYELSMLTDMKARLCADSTVLDVGANIGNHTFYLAHVLRCQVIAFEANDELAHAMDITVSEAGLEEQVTVHAFALGDKPGFAEFEQAIPENLGGQSLRKGTGRSKVRTLDSFGISAPVAAIKIDVEGMELDVLKGGKRIIESSLPMLYVESQTKESFIEISAYLTTLGYCYRDTFNATPTHLFVHNTKLGNDEQVASVALNRVEHEYDLLAANKKVKKDLIDCQMKYRELCQLNTVLKSENEQLQGQALVSKATSGQSDGARLQDELQRIEQKLDAANQLIARLKDEVARERTEKEYQAHQFSQSKLTSRLDVALQEKLTAEVERLTAENRSQAALLDGQQAMKFALEDGKKKCAEMSFILENSRSEVLQLQGEKSKLLAIVQEKGDENDRLLHLKEELAGLQNAQQLLHAELETQVDLVARLQSEKAQLSSALTASRDESAKAGQLERALFACKKQLAQLQEDNTRLQVEVDNLSQALTIAQQEALKVKELEERQADYSSKMEQATEDMIRLASELESSRKDAARVPDLELELAKLNQQHTQYISTIESLKAEHSQYIRSLREFHEQQRQDSEQQLHILIQRKMASLAPLQANQEKLDKLIEYRNEIETIYSERAPLLNDLALGEDIEKIQEKKVALDALNRNLAEFNNR